jgi:hypothetical protein
VTAYVTACGPLPVSAEGCINRVNQALTSENFTVGPVGLEPTTYGLKVRSSNH